MSEKSIFVQCFNHHSPWLEQEVRDLGYSPTKVTNAGLWLKGDLKDCMRLNFALRTANRVLFELDSFRAVNGEQLYRQILRMPWERILPVDGYLSVHGFVRNDTIRDNRFAFMKAKDGIVDRISDKTSRRPDSGPKTDHSVIYLHWLEDSAIVYLDTSGDTLGKHGYRKFPGKAPMMESLASATILATGWDRKRPFVNPMCGSGTLAIEAALMAKNKFPGHFRTNFGFMHCTMFNAQEWSEVKQEFSGMEKTFPRIIASDHDRGAIRNARKNAEAAGVEEDITFVVCDFADTRLPQEPGVVFLNPEYGERLGETQALESVYGRIGDFFKSKAQGYMGYIFTGNLDLMKKVGLRTKRKIPFFNARIECRLLEYEMYAGSRKKAHK